MKKPSHNIKPKITLGGVILAAAAAWLAAAGTAVIFSPDAGISVNFAKGTSLSLYILLIFVYAVPVFLADIFFSGRNISSYALVCSLIFFSFTMCAKDNNMYTYIFLFIVLAVVLYCFDKKTDSRLIHFDNDKKIATGIIAAVTVSAFAAVCSIGVLRYFTYSSPNYDFGIFCNMFYNMRETGRAVSTCERDTLLWHFSVHISPVFYLLLPIYFIFPSPVTLAVMQPLIVFSGVIPVYLLSRHFKHSENTTMFICIAYAVFTPISSGCFYDIHENCFLVPFILWMFYFFEKDRKIPLFIFMALVLLVKEDAFVYVAVFALYVGISRKKYLTSSAMLVISGAYFLTACFLLTKYGSGVMSSRYSNLDGGDGLLGTAKTLLMNPGYAASQILETKSEDMEKLFYLAKLFCPLAFIPFMNRNLSRYILILPVFINLLTKYVYQYDIAFQYTFGISAFLFYIVLLNLSDFERKKQEKLSFCSVIASVLLFVMIVVPKCGNYIAKYSTGKETYAKITQVLELIPPDAQVTSSTYFLAHIADRDVIYEDEYHETPSTEYFVLDARNKVAQTSRKKYIEAGYELVFQEEDIIEIYRNPAMAPTEPDN